jgi:HEAT repeat protein
VSGSGPPSGGAEWLRRKLHLGVRAEDFAQLRVALELPASSDELALARKLVEQIARQSIAGVSLADEVPQPGPGDESRIIVDGRASFLMRLTTGGAAANVDLARISDLRTLTAVLRAGNLRQRRAATLRIGELVADGHFSGDEARIASDALEHPRAVSTAYEAFSGIVRGSGAEGRRVRAASQQWEALAAQCEAELPPFWEGDRSEEPIMALPDHERVQLLMRTRDLSDDLVRHLSAVISGGDGAANRRTRAALIGALQYAGDPRLLPALRAVLIEGDSELFAGAARALGHIDDPRARTALRALYQRTTAPEQRLLLAGALGLAGDGRGLGYVREVLAKGDDRLLRFALEALSELGGSDDVQAVTELLTRREPVLVLQAVQTLGRIGDARALVPLSELARNAKSSGLRAEIEDAQDAIHARMELLGEEPFALGLATHSFDTAKRVALVKRKDPAAVRLRARFAYLMGQFWLSVGAFGRALPRLEAASALRPDWVAPVLSVAMAYARRDESAQALASFRRALGIDQKAVENHRAPARMLAHCFLRRAEAMARAGREDIARGLLEEALSIDLRKAPSDLRFALEQRLQALEVKAA